MVHSLFNLALGTAPYHPVIDRLNLTWNDLRNCFAMRKMNTQLFMQHFDRIRYWNWAWISEYMALDESFIYTYCCHVDWERISRYQRLTPTLVAKFETDISWAALSANPHLTIDLVRLYCTRLDWGLVCKTIVLTEDQIDEFLRYIDWYEVSLKSPMREPFIEKYAERVHWARITAHQTLTDTFIEKHTDRVDWDYLSRHRPMISTFIQTYADYVDWGLISDGQKLDDDDFIRDNTTRVDWEEIAYGQPISETFFEESAPKTPAVWAAFTAGRTLSPGFIARNIASLPARELTRFQSFTLAEVAKYAAYLDWRQLSAKHTFTHPGKTVIDEDFIRSHAERIDWPLLVQTHVLPTRLLLDFIDRISPRDIQQTISIEELERHPQLINRTWISHNCPLTVEYLTAAAQMIDWNVIANRHLPEEVVRAFAPELNISRIPMLQPHMSPEWVTMQLATEQEWTMVVDIAPRYWPLYASADNIARLVTPPDEFFRRYRDQALASPRFLIFEGTNILLNTLVSSIHLCRPELADRIRFKCAVTELHVPSSWDYLENTSDENWVWIVKNHRLSETFLRRFHHKVDWSLIPDYQVRPFSEQFMREFAGRLDLAKVPLPYDVTMDYIRQFGTRHNWAELTRNFQEWQMEHFGAHCNFSKTPRKTLSEAFITLHYPIEVVAATQPLSEAYIETHLTQPTYERLAQNTTLIVSQRFMRRHRSSMPNAHWVRASNQTLAATRTAPFETVPISQAELSRYSQFKLANRGIAFDPIGPPDLSICNQAHFWTRYRLPESTLRQLIQTVPWHTISMYQKLSPEFLEEFKDRVDWGTISRWQVLSEETIRRFKDYVHWPQICRNQKLTEDFISEFADRVTWEPLSPFSACF